MKLKIDGRTRVGIVKLLGRLPQLRNKSELRRKIADLITPAIQRRGLSVASAWIRNH